MSFAGEQKPTRTLMDQIDELIAGAENARVAGDAMAAIVLALAASQMLQVQKALDGHAIVDPNQDEGRP